jgi:hypothetical protein
MIQWVNYLCACGYIIFNIFRESSVDYFTNVFNIMLGMTT